jgi:ketosteroid isomerase-like protein
MKWLGWLFVAAVLAGLGWWGWQRVFVTDEQRVRRQLAALARAVETAHLLKLEDGIAQDYTDDFGFDKSTIIGGVRQFRAQHDAVLILLTELTVEIDPDRPKAQALFIAKILAKAKGSLSETEVRAERYRVYLRKTDAGWKVTRVESPALKFD